MGFCCGKEDIGLNSKYNREKWEFIASKLVGGQWMGTYEGSGGVLGN